MDGIGKVRIPASSDYHTLNGGGGKLPNANEPYSPPVNPGLAEPTDKVELGNKPEPEKF